jgi:hypothetical protein
VKSGARVTKDNTKALLANIRAMQGKQVLVGVPEEKASRKASDGVSNAQLAYINENGSPAQNIPERPFLVPGVEEARADVARLLEAGARRGLEKPDEVDKALERAGLRAVSSVKAVITRNNFAPLKAATLRARKRLGFLGTKALIVTGQLRNAITYVVRRK